MQAGRVRSHFNVAYPGIGRFIAAAKVFAKRFGAVPTVSGRLRYLPEIRDPNPVRASYAARQAVNSIVQGTAADVIKIAMILVQRYLLRGMPARLLLQVHDELLIEAPEELAQQLTAKITRIMVEDVPAALAEVASAPGGLWEAAPAQAAPAQDGVAAGDSTTACGARRAAARALLGGSPLLCVPLEVAAEVGSDWGHMTRVVANAGA